MPDLIKQEIRRLARREANSIAKNIKRDTAALKRASARLKRTVSFLERAVARHQGAVAQWRREAAKADPAELRGARFRKDTVATLRKRLRLTQRAFARLAGVSLPTVHKWETGTMPRASQRAAVLGLRKLTAREAREILESGK